MKVIGEIDIGIAFTTPTVIGTLKADIPSILIVEAVQKNNRVSELYKNIWIFTTGITLSVKEI